MKRIEFDFMNIGGIHKIYAVPQSSFLRIREDATSGACYLDLTRADDIIDLYLIYDTARFDEDQIYTSHGVLYEVSVSGIIPKSNPVNQNRLRILENEPLFVLFTDNNGCIRLAGTPENRLLFSRKETSGTLNSRNQIEFEIKGKQTRPCYFIDSGVFESIE